MVGRPNNGSRANTKFLKNQLSKMAQLVGFLGRLLVPLLKTRLPLIANVLKLLAKSVVITWGLTATISAVDAGMPRKNPRNRASFEHRTMNNNIYNLK